MFYYRPTKPPILTGHSLAYFFKLLSRTGILARTGKFSCRLYSWGTIYKDEGTLASESPSEADALCKDFPSLLEKVSHGGDDIRVARVSLGNAVGCVTQALTRQRLPQNEQPMILDKVGFEIGIIESALLVSEKPVLVGHMALWFSGTGNPYPWSFRDMIDRAEALPEIRAMTELCRETWPVKPAKPSWREKRKRRRMGRLWPYEGVDWPMDWFWGLAEKED